MFRRVTSALDALPVIVAAVLVGGFVFTFFSLLFVGHPDIGWSDHVMGDAKALATGHFQYGDPARGYVGMLYTPLFTGVVAVLVRVRWWEGWGPVVSMLAVAAALFALGRMVWRAGGAQRARIVSVAAVVALPLFAFTIFSTNGVFEGRTDQLAWSLFVFAACRIIEDLVSANIRSTRGRVFTGALLALSALAKQTTVSACLVAAVVVGIVYWRAGSTDGAADPAIWRRRLPVEALTLAGIFGLALLVLQVASDGFAFDLLFQLPQRQARVVSVRDTLKADLKLIAVPIVVLLVAVAVCVIGERRRREHAETRPASPFLPLAAAVVLAASTVPGALLAQSKQGGDTNNLAGPVWGLALILATALVVTEPVWRAHAVRAAGVLLLVSGAIGSFSTAFDESAFGAPSLDLTRHWDTVPQDLVAAADHGRTVFDWQYPSRSITPDEPDYPAGGAPPDLAAAGYAPRWVIRNLLDGRYDRVRLYPAFLDIYMSAYGKRDTALAWKIDYLIKHGYRALPDIRNGETFYEPSPKLRDVQGLYQCFGPYEAGDLRIAVKEGGGLWCARKGGLDLVDGPNKTSELVLHADSPTTFDVQLRDAGRVRLQPLDGDGRPVADCLEHLPATATVISIRVHPERHDGKCAAGGLTGPGQSRVDVEVDASSVSLVADVAAHVRLTHVRSRGKDVAVKLHDPTPGELNGE